LKKQEINIAPAKPFDFWSDHSRTFLEMAFDMTRRGKIALPDGHGEKTGECGDTVEMFIKTDPNGAIEQVRFVIRGCRNTHASANAVAVLAEGEKTEAAWEITRESVIGVLETLPPDHFHCAELAVGAFYLALADCRNRIPIE